MFKRFKRNALVEKAAEILEHRLTLPLKQGGTMSFKEFIDEIAYQAVEDYREKKEEADHLNAVANNYFVPLITAISQDSPEDLHLVRNAIGLVPRYAEMLDSSVEFIENQGEDGLPLLALLVFALSRYYDDIEDILQSETITDAYGLIRILPSGPLVSHLADRSKEIDFMLALLDLNDDDIDQTLMRHVEAGLIAYLPYIDGKLFESLILNDYDNRSFTYQTLYEELKALESDIKDKRESANFPVWENALTTMCETLLKIVEGRPLRMIDATTMQKDQIMRYFALALSEKVEDRQILVDRFYQYRLNVDTTKQTHRDVLEIAFKQMSDLTQTHVDLLDIRDLLLSLSRDLQLGEKARNR